MAAIQRVRATTKTRTRKPSSVPSGNVKCNICRGKGYYPKPKRGK